MAETEKKPAEEGPRSFTVFMRDLSDGEAEGELSYQLHELCKRMQEEAAARNDKVKGKLALTVSLQAEPSGIVGVSYAVDVKAPKRRTSPAVFWLTRGGNLTGQNPKQQKLPLREVAAPPAEARDVDAPSSAREV